MDRDDAWMAITKITNKRNVTKADIAEVRRLMTFLPEEQQADMEEVLFLLEGAK